MSSVALAHDFSLGSVGSFINKCTDFLYTHLADLAENLKGVEGMEAAASTLETLPPGGLAALFIGLLKVAGAAETQIKQCKPELARTDSIRKAAEKNLIGYQRAVRDYQARPPRASYMRDDIDMLARQYALE